MVNGNVSIAMHTAFFQVLATSGYNHVSQSDSRIQILLQLEWMARFSLLQPDVARTWEKCCTSQEQEHVRTTSLP